MKKALAMFAAALIMLINITISVNSTSTPDPFEAEGYLSEFKGVDDYRQYYESKSWVNEPWYSDDYYHTRIDSIKLISVFLFIPKDYNKEDIIKIWLDDVKLIVFFKDGSKLSQRFRDSADSDIHTPEDFIYTTGNDAEFTELDGNDIDNVMYEYSKITNFSGIFLRFSSLDELLDYIDNEKWNYEVWYHPAKKNSTVDCMKKYLRNYLFIPQKYEKEDITEISFSDKGITIICRNASNNSYKYEVFEKAKDITTSLIWVKYDDISSTKDGKGYIKMHNIMPGNNTDIIEPIDPIESNINDSE